MKKWLKKWWFSIVMWLFAILLFAYTIVAINVFDEELLFYTLILTSCITPTLLLFVIGIGNMPKKGEEE